MSADEQPELRWVGPHQHLRGPVLIASFEGWNDAGDAASSAVGHLAEIWDAETFAEIDPEEFYDFTNSRPQVELDPELGRVIRWPQNEFMAAVLPDAKHDVILLAGDEPQLRWRRFCSHILSLATECEVSMVITLGALLADVPHTRPVRVTGTSADEDLITRHGLARSRYEGPTGIVGVLHDALASLGIRSLSLWAAVPHYLPSTTNPKAALALVEKAADIMGMQVPTLGLEVASVEYERQVNEIVEADEEMLGFLRQLEINHDEGDTDDDDDDDDDEVDARTAFSDSNGKLLTGDALAEELERFLRDQG